MDMLFIRQRRIVEPILTRLWRNSTAGCCASGGQVVDVGANFGWYSLLSLSLGCSVVGFEPVGDIEPSGWWPSEAQPATVDLSELDNAAWHASLEAEVHVAAERQYRWPSRFLGEWHLPILKPVEIEFRQRRRNMHELLQNGR